MKYNIKLVYLKKLGNLSAQRQITVYNIINKMVSHFNVNGKKKKLINMVFKFFQAYDLKIKPTLKELEKSGVKTVNFKKTSYPYQNLYFKSKIVAGFSGVFYQTRPLFDTKKVRKGPKYYDVPYRLSLKRSQILVLRWFSQAIKAKTARSLTIKIKNEIQDLITLNGSTYSEIVKLRKHVLANLMYSHYRWWNKKKK